MRLSWIVYTGCRLTLGLIFLTSGLGKFYGDSGLMGPGWLFERLRPYGLEPYGVFIATSQLVVGYLLLVRRFATLGAVMVLPILLNILVIVITLHWQGTPYVVAVFLAMNCYLLAYDFHKLKFLISEDTSPLRSLPIVRQSRQFDALYAVGLFFFLGSAVLHYQANWAFAHWLKPVGTAYLLLVAGFDWYRNRAGNRKPPVHRNR